MAGGPDLGGGLDGLRGCHGDGPGAGPRPGGEGGEVVGGQRLRGGDAVRAAVGGQGSAVGAATWRQEEPGRGSGSPGSSLTSLILFTYIIK